MDPKGIFRKEKNDGKLFLVYHNPKFHQKPQTQTLVSSAIATSHDQPLSSLFLCPRVRWQNDYSNSGRYFPLRSSPEYGFSRTRYGDDHPVLPLFWCNNKEFDSFNECRGCTNSNFGTDYYFCEYCRVMFHKECVQSPFRIEHPYHPEHSLQLYYHSSDYECFCCGRRANLMAYYCTICHFFMHPICAMKSISFVIDQPKRHDHSLTFFPRQISLICNVCGLVRKKNPTYVCLECNFVAHNDCMYAPRIIKISRHHHRISFIHSLISGRWSCGVCRQRVDSGYGAYTCDKCSDYVVHSKCALEKDVWNGEELEGVKEEDDITQDLGPFDMISKGVIFHFLHDHYLRLEIVKSYDETKLCEACVLPIFEGKFYSCVKYCDFIFHETCAKLSRRIQHVLHPHPLTLRPMRRYEYGSVTCNACDLPFCGFIYECPKWECIFGLDVRCASISEPFDYKGHKHPLFLLGLSQGLNSKCGICKTKCHKQLNCIKCKFIVCFKCATLPYKARYKHDIHFLTLLSGVEIYERNFCEVCEGSLKDTNTKVFYWCDKCCSSFHIECLFGDAPYLKPCRSFKIDFTEIQILGKTNLARPVCDVCKKRCQGNRFVKDNRTACSWKCAKTFSRFYIMDDEWKEDLLSDESEPEGGAFDVRLPRLRS